MATITRPTTAVAVPAESAAAKASRYLYAGLRLALGWTFLWAFLDRR
jgi:thiosulfate dehydrogenase [quinone] large subunit